MWALRSFASYLLAIVVGIGAVALLLAGFALTVLGVLSVQSGEPRGWWIPLGLVLLVVSFLPVYSLFNTYRNPHSR